jgi:hypothetical protein
VQLTSGPAGFSSSRTAAFAWRTTGGVPASVTCSLDSTTPVPCGSPWTIRGLGNGGHRFTVRAANAAGWSSVTYSWTVFALFR